MILTPKQIDCVYKMVGEEPAPGAGIHGAFKALSQAVSRDVWAKSVDIAVLGGDPLIVCLRIQAFLDAYIGTRPPRIAIIPPRAFSCAPLAALEDPKVQGDFRSRGAGTSAMHNLLTGGSDQRIKEMLSHLAIGLSGRLESLSAKVWIANRGVEGSRLSPSQFILRLTYINPEDRTDPKPVEGLDSAELFNKSASLCAFGWSEIHRSLRKITSAPPSKLKYAQIFVAKEVIILSGFVAPPGSANDPSDMTAFCEDVLGGETYALASGSPLKVSDAIDAWRDDLARATFPTRATG
jgi:hypothetical protein